MSGPIGAWKRKRSLWVGPGSAEELNLGRKQLGLAACTNLGQLRLAVPSRGKDACALLRLLFRLASGPQLSEAIFFVSCPLTRPP